jgi:hypothetical protein
MEPDHAGTQGAPVKPKDFGSTVLPAHFPVGLFEHPEDMLFLDRFHGVRSLREKPGRFCQLIGKVQFATR